MNESIFFFFYNLTHQSNLFDGFVTFFAVYFLYIIIALAFLFLYGRWREFILLCVSGGFAFVVAKILKVLIHTPRPFDVFPQVQSLFTETGYAFPSGHTLVASAVAFALLFTNKKAGYLFIFFALLVGLARVTAGVHFPVDILGGFVLGYLVALCVRKLVSKFNFY